MARDVQMLDWAQRFRRASESQDWHALAAVDRELSATWTALSARGPWTPVERAALASLREAHRHAVERVTQESERMQERLTALSAGREGWLAYAAHGELKGDAA